MTKTPSTPADVAIARAICDDLRASMRSLMSLRNPRGARLKRDLRAAQAHLSTVEASLLASIMAENPAGNDRVTATIILDARVGQVQRDFRELDVTEPCDPSERWVNPMGGEA